MNQRAWQAAGGESHDCCRQERRVGSRRIRGRFKLVESDPLVAADGLSRRGGSESHDLTSAIPGVALSLPKLAPSPRSWGWSTSRRMLRKSDSPANDASSPFGWTEGQKQIRPDSQKFATLTSQGMLEDVTEGLPMADRELAFAVQGQNYGPMFDEKLTVAAWKTKPAWAIISTKDRMLPPAMEAAAAKRMGAAATTLSTCHMSIIEEPVRIAKVLDEAARNALRMQSELEKAANAGQGN